ncbi:hypothetical protein Aperf_G00000084343 [Anoplocephala perfoliata]
MCFKRQNGKILKRANIPPDNLSDMELGIKWRITNKHASLRLLFEIKILEDYVWESKLPSFFPLYRRENVSRIAGHPRPSTFGQEVAHGQMSIRRSGKSMIAKLVVEYGSLFKNKLKGMFKDMSVFKSLMEEFQSQSNSAPLGMDLYVRVFTTGLWPIQSSSPDVSLPAEAEQAFNVFAGNASLAVRTCLGAFRQRMKSGAWIMLNP